MSLSVGRRLAGVVACSLIVASQLGWNVAVAPIASATPACDGGARYWQSQDNLTTAPLTGDDGTKAWLAVPYPIGDPHGYQHLDTGNSINTGEVMAYKIDSVGTNFITTGWYTGTNGILPYASTPTLWWAENVAGSTAVVYETSGTTLARGTHSFQVQRNNSTGYYNVFLDGVLKGTSLYVHDTDMISTDWSQAIGACTQYSNSSDANYHLTYFSGTTGYNWFDANGGKSDTCITNTFYYYQTFSTDNIAC